MSYPSHSRPELSDALIDMVTTAMALALGPSPSFERRREWVRGVEDGARGSMYASDCTVVRCGGKLGRRSSVAAMAWCTSTLALRKSERVIGERE